ncbi:conserved hypothetical protein [Leptospira interrogans serovar Manilae]|uniref:Uncharacterized protein n=1 Tax=Leptospira interrogans serovar Manilae TaxID=214675 RepID=A0AAQ1NUJ8_LEPIR|nr:conserved hypothetical protein [Leptospira interrogans serovar Manilae]
MQKKYFVLLNYKISIFFNMNVFYVAICSILELLKKFIEAVNKIASIDCFNRLLQSIAL